VCRMSDGQTGVEGDEEVEEGDRDGICCKSPGPETKLQVNCKRLPGGVDGWGAAFPSHKQHQRLSAVPRSLFFQPNQGAFLCFFN